MRLVSIDARRITDEDALHDAFAEAFGFPPFYGRNMNAWIDCMSYLDDPSAEMTAWHVAPGEVVVLDLGDATDLYRRRSDLYAAIVDCAAFVNKRRIDAGDASVLALAYFKDP
ncbi:barstar family protein [Paludisphaera mucosa]|uniref:Barstar family protein n=1 Tax=Paludisphaera mucosa TaxID=3030827 RepID=A0ABT6FJ21_9BACT|nr:barstar family protein [Paludisphaera mucosa]MDG3007547.1 barstar family protein [Paludisphaera mucosa]